MRDIVSPIDGIRSPFGARRGAAIFSPASLFAAGEQGVWYDPSDMTTLFQNSSGTTLVTAVEQPVGLMLDKSRPPTLGPELVTNGDFANGTTGWTAGTVLGSRATIAVTSGELRVTTIDTFGRAGQSFSTVAGKWYQVTTRARLISGGGIVFAEAATALSGGTTLGNSFAIATSSSTAAAQSFLFLATGTTTWVLLLASAASAVAGFDDVSVKEIAGNHATQSIDAARPVLSARVNLLTKTEQFDDAVWTKSAASITANTVATTDPLGTNTADILVEDSSASVAHFVSQSISTIINISYTYSVCAKSAGRNWLRISGSNLGFSTPNHAWFDLQNGVLGTVESGTSASITSLGNGWYRCSWTRAANQTNASAPIFTCAQTANNETIYTGTGINSLYIWGADLRVANDTALPVYQRVGVGTPGSSTGAGSSDYTVTGFPLYLRFDGTDDFMVSPTITPGIDKAQVFAGVRKLNQSAVNMIAEFSADKNSNNGVFALYNGATDGFVWISKGTSEGASSSTSGFTAPVSAVLTGIGNIAGDISTLQANATQIASSSSNQGTGNYLAYPLYIGARGGSSLFLNGRIYSLIVRFGSNLSETLIGQTENWISGKMGGGYYPTGYDFLVDANGNQLTDASGNPLIAQALYS